MRVLVVGTKASRHSFFSGGEAVGGTADQSVPQGRSLSEAEREALFKRLHLAHMRHIYQRVAVQAEKEGWSYADFLTVLLAEEVAGRKHWKTPCQGVQNGSEFPEPTQMEAKVWSK
jgi:hypothetical protein